MTEQTVTWNPIIAEDEVQAPTIPTHSIFSLPVGMWEHIPEIDFVNFYPAHASRKHDPRTRQVVFLLAINSETGMVIVVQSSKVSCEDMQLSLIQGGIKINETAYDAASREAWEEAGLQELTGLQYIKSYKAPISTRTEKGKRWDHQLFHCFVALTEAVAVRPQSGDVAYATLLHQTSVLQALLSAASPVKQELLPPLFSAAVAKGYLPPQACRVNS